jgi:hypothetical protein
MGGEDAGGYTHEQQTLRSVSVSSSPRHAFYNSLPVVTVELFFRRDLGHPLPKPSFTQSPPIALRNVLPTRNLNSPQNSFFSHIYQQPQSPLLIHFLKSHWEDSTPRSKW